MANQDYEPVPVCAERLYSVKHAAQYMGVKINTLDRRLRLGRFPFIRIGPRLRRIRHTDIQAYLASNPATPFEPDPLPPLPAFSERAMKRSL